jgi:hypothetical protein
VSWFRPRSVLRIFCFSLSHSFSMHSQCLLSDSSNVYKIIVTTAVSRENYCLYSDWHNWNDLKYTSVHKGYKGFFISYVFSCLFNDCQQSVLPFILKETLQQHQSFSQNLLEASKW